MSERVERCSRCRFWDDDYTVEVDRGVKGACRQRSPVLFTRLLFHNTDEDYWDGDDLRNATVFPITLAHDWCGEFQRVSLVVVPYAPELLTAPPEAMPPPTPEVLAIKIVDLDLPLRVVKALGRKSSYDGGEWMSGRSILTIGDLLNHTADDLLERNYFGPTSLVQVQAVLAKFGLSLKECAT